MDEISIRAELNSRENPVRRAARFIAKHYWPTMAVGSGLALAGPSNEVAIGGTLVMATIDTVRGFLFNNEQFAASSGRQGRAQREANAAWGRGQVPDAARKKQEQARKDWKKIQGEMGL